ncbi:MAG: pyridoxal-phosphate dependent enzyme [Theionarchaea archaeon]|nr:pyridoxal-phosphate dependent enzyme [Theionarchaea archaeon]
MIICSRCRRVHHDGGWRCECGGPLEIKDERAFEIGELESLSSLWRYRSFIGTEPVVTFHEGFTPLIEIENLYYKLDFLFPTGSFKDRGTTVMMSALKAAGVTNIVEDSSGNAGASVAAYAARAGIQATIYVPDYASSGKIAQIQAFGAHIVRVKGTREDTQQAALSRTEELTYASHQWNPYFLEGMKTVAYEICEQLNWRAPEAVLIPVGSGSLYYGAYKGFKHLKESGIIDEIPLLLGVEPELCSPVYDELHGIHKPCGKSIAEGLLVEHPPRLKEIVDVVRNHGDIMLVSEAEILRGLKRAVRMGLYVEPTSAVVLAASEKIQEREKVVLILTGSGLKAVQELGDLL